MTTNSSLLKDSVVLQSFGPLNEALHFRIAHIWLTFVATCFDQTAEAFMKHICGGIKQLRAAAGQTCDERLSLEAACQVGQRAVHLTNSHLGTHQVGH